MQIVITLINSLGCKFIGPKSIQLVAPFISLPKNFVRSSIATAPIAINLDDFFIRFIIFFI